MKIKSGARNSTLTSIAGALRRRAVAQVAIDAALLAINREQCEPPLPEFEVKGIARSITRYQPNPMAVEKLSVSAPPVKPQITTLQDIPDPRSLLRDPVRFLVEDLIPHNAVTVIAGEFSVGKSWLALILAAELIRGGTFIAREVTPTKEVLYLDRENGLSVVQERMDALYREGEMAHTHWGMWCEMEPPILGNPLLLKFARPGAVMIFDTLIRFHSADENNPSQMAQVMACLRQLQSRGASVIALHHRDKKLEAGYRGTAEIAAGCDLLFTLCREEGTNVVLRAVKHRIPVDELVTFAADWGNARLVRCETRRAGEKRALIEQIRQQIRQNPGISQSRVLATINSSLVKPVSRWQIQTILDQQEGSLWRVERGPSGAKTRYYDVFSIGQRKLLVEDNVGTGVQQLGFGRPAEAAEGAPAAFGAERSITSGQPAAPGGTCQQLSPTKAADLLPPLMGGSQQPGQEVGTRQPHDLGTNDDEGAPA